MKLPIAIISATVVLLLILSSLGALNFSSGFNPSAASEQGSLVYGCYNTVPSGTEILSQNGSVTVVLLPNGETVTYSLAAGTCQSTEGYPLTISGIIEYEEGINNNGFSSLSGQLYTPQNPSNQGSQLATLWQGLQTSGGGTIAQPVVVWGCQTHGISGGCSQGGNYWWISAELCTQGSLGSCTATSAIQGGIGDNLQLSVTYVVSHGRACSGYYITMNDVTRNQRPTEIDCIGSPSYPDALTGALEGRNFNSCNQLPNQYSAYFSSVASSPSISAFEGYVNQGSPQCGYSVSAGSGYTQLNWSP